MNVGQRLLDVRPRCAGKEPNRGGRGHHHPRPGRQALDSLSVVERGDVRTQQLVTALKGGAAL